MKKFFCSIFLELFFTIIAFAATPQTISYQAIVKDNTGSLLANTPVGVRITILQYSENGSVVYTETRQERTNSNGLVDFAIGDGNGTSTYNISDIDWSDGPFFLRCEIDKKAGTNYTLALTSQIMSVPYALYAERVSPDALPSWVSAEKPTYQYDEIQNTPTIPSKTSELENDANYVTVDQIPNYQNAVGDLDNEKEYITFYVKKSQLPSTNGITAAEAAATYQPKGNYLTEHQSLEEYAKKSEIPNTDELQNTIEGIQSTIESIQAETGNMLSEAEAQALYQPKGDYLTEHQSLDEYAKKSEIPNNYLTRDSLKNLNIPTKVSELENDKEYITINDIPQTEMPTKVSELENDANYITLNDVPTTNVPTKVSELENDANYVKASEIPSTEGLLSATEAQATYQPKGDYLTEHQSLEGYAMKSEIPTNVSALTNDANYITLADVPQVTVPSKVSDLENDKNYIVKADIPVAAGITETDTTRWGNKLSAETDPIFNASVASTITNDDIEKWNNKTEQEIDPLFAQSAAASISAEDVAKWNAKPDEVPANVSSFANDAEYITKAELNNLATLVNSLASQLTELNEKNTQLLSKVDSLSTVIDSLNTKTNGSGNTTPATEDPTTDNPTDPSTGDPSTDNPSTDDPSTGDPSTDDPSTDDPTVEDPIVEDPGIELKNQSVVTGDMHSNPAPYYMFTPSEDITFTTFSVLSGREYLTSSSNDIHSICVYKLYEASDYTTSASLTSIVSLNSAMVQGYANADQQKAGNAQQLAWFDGAKGQGVSASNGGLHKVYGQTYQVGNQTMYKYTTKLNNGGKITLKAGHIYLIGIVGAFYNANAAQGSYAMFSYSGAENYNKIAKLDNGFTTTSSGHGEHSTRIQSVESPAGLPCLWFDDVLYNHYKTNNSTASNNNNNSSNTTPTTSFSQASNYSYANQLNRSNFNDIQNVYQKINTGNGDRLVVIMRHSERGSDYSVNGGLTQNGINLAKNVGAKLKGYPFNSTENDYFASTGVKRTMETAYYLANGRGNYSMGSYYDVLASTNEAGARTVDSRLSIATENFCSSTDWNTVANYYDNNKSDVNTKSLKRINQLCALTDGHPLSIIISHDTEMVPLIEWASNGSIQITSSNWCNYMSGVAIIVHSNGSWEAYPLKSLDKGFLN